MDDKNETADKNCEIDELFYSRQLYVLGHDGMKKLNTSNVLISGMNGLGVEIAKNVILSGVKLVTIHDQQNCQLSDLSSQFYLTTQNIGENRAEISVKKLKELNDYVQVSAYTGNLSTEYISEFDVIVLTQSSNKEQLELAKYAHKKGIAVIIATTAGLFGQIFCDFGEEFLCCDTTGEQPLSMVSFITNEKEGVVSCLDGARHGFEDGDYVKFVKVKGMTELNNCEPFKIKVLGPYSFSIGDTTSFSSYLGGGFVKKVKMPQKFKFKSLQDSLKKPEILCSDPTKLDKSIQLHIAFRALHEYKLIFDNQLPKPWNKEDAKKFLVIFSTILKNEYAEYINSIDKNLIEKFSFICSGNCSPIQSVLGGIVAQEVLKACTGKFVPIRQWFYYDALECLPLEDLDENDCAPINSRYDGQIAIFGKKFQEKLLNLNYFIIGAGAIGCELLKNFALIGVGCSPNPLKGQVILTDMDTVKKSDLNRQFLFRQSDFGIFKSIAAGHSIKKINPDFKIISHMNEVCSESENIYNTDFYEKLDGVANALDNVHTRNYIDRVCVRNRKSLLDSGISSTKGSNQVIIPHLTESYTSSSDPDERVVFRKFPICPEDNIFWGREEFEKLFHYYPECAKRFIKDSKKNFEDEVEYVHNLLIKNKATNFADCIKWARLRFEEIFNNKIKQLLLNAPPDVNQLNPNFQWYKSSHYPSPIEFNIENDLHIDYVVAAANLYAFIYNIPQCRDRKMIINQVAEIDVPEFIPKSDSIQINFELLEKERKSQLSNLLESSQLNTIKINSTKFEMDCDNNFHLDFIVACSNLRAEIYDVEYVDHHKIKLIADRIIPTIITTTSVVSGFSCLELLKLVQGHTKLDLFKNGFINLAIPLFVFSEPMKVLKNKYYENEFTIWDRIEVKGEMTLSEFIDYFKNVHKLKITILTSGTIMLYSNFIRKEKYQEIIDLTLNEILKKNCKKEINENVEFLDFEIGCEDLNGEDVEVPYVRYILPKKL